LAAACAAGVILGVELSQQSSEKEVALTNTLNAVSTLDLGEGA
jgi:hypothetical protein